MKKMIGAAVLAMFAGVAMAEKQAGIELYPGAKADATVAKQLKEKMHITGTTYRTSDSVTKVADFYRKQKLEEAPGTNNNGAMFMAKGANVSIQNPWMDMDSGKINNDTLISIVPRK